MISKLKWLFTIPGLVTALIVFWLYTNPASAAVQVRKGLGVVSHAAHSAQTFLSRL